MPRPNQDPLYLFQQAPHAAVCGVTHNDGTGEDRRTMVTLMTGPVLERLRMAQEDARIRGGDIGEDI